MKPPESLETPVEPGTAPPEVIHYPPTPLSWRLAILAGIVAIGGIAYATRGVIGLRGQSLAGIFFFFGLVAAFSANLRAVNWRTIGWGIALQLVFAAMVLDPPIPGIGKIRVGNVAVGFGSVAIVDTKEPPYTVQPGDTLETIAQKYDVTRESLAKVNGIASADTVRPGQTLVVRFWFYSVYNAFDRAGDVVKSFISFSDKGAEFVFGNLAHPEHMSNVFAKDYIFPFAFKALPPILFVSAFFTVLYHFGILQLVVRAFARIMLYLMRTSGAETLSVAANVFMGQTEAPLIIRPYVPRMTNSELFVLMASGMAHISGALMAVYISYGANPVAVISTCVMACPCSLYLSKLFLPEISKPETSGAVHKEGMKSPHVNAIDAAAAGTTDGLNLALNVAAMLIVFIAFVAMFNGLLGLIDTAWLSAHTGWNLPDQITLQWLFGKLFSPLAFLIGITIDDIERVGALLGEKLAINEHYAFLDMSKMLKTPNLMSDRSYRLAAFALTGFANFSSVGIQLGGIGALAPNRRHDLARLGLRALFVGFTASLLNAAVAGIMLEEVLKS